jgi:hypothetical protein
MVRRFAIAGALALVVLLPPAAALKPGTALLWVIGYKDPLFAWGSFYAFDKAPPNAKSKYLAFDAGHLDTPDKSVTIMLDWLKSLAAN